MKENSSLSKIAEVSRYLIITVTNTCSMLKK
jgi:hypothetical protein